MTDPVMVDTQFDAMSKLESFKMERNYLHNQLSFKTVNEDSGHDIIEVFTEEEDKAWREQHREKVRQYKQKNAKGDETQTRELTDEEIWNRLEELELQEELDNEFSDSSRSKMNDSRIAKHTDNDTAVEEAQQFENATSEEDSVEDDDGSSSEDNDDDICDRNAEQLKMSAKSSNVFYDEIYTANIRGNSANIPDYSKLVLLERVVNSNNALKALVLDLKARNIIRIKNEKAVIARFRELERLKLIEPYSETSDDSVEFNDDYEEIENLKPRKSVAFADKDDSETLELTFKHSNIERASTPYDPEKGIKKPSDIYEACSSLFSDETTSILKKTKSVAPSEESNSKQKDDGVEVMQGSNLNRTVLLKDIVEKENCSDNNSNNNERPMSLFKKMRRQQK